MRAGGFHNFENPDSLPQPAAKPSWNVLRKWVKSRQRRGKERAVAVSIEEISEFGYLSKEVGKGRIFFFGGP